MSGTSKTKLIESIQQMVAGLTKHYAGQTLPLNGTAAPVAAIIAQLDAFAPEVAAGTTAETAWKQQLVAANTMETSVVRPLLLALRSCMVAAFGGSSPTLVDFGVAPRKPVVRSTQAKAATAAKARATRAARGTKGKRQRASIHGAVPPAPTPPAPGSTVAPSIATPANAKSG